MTDEDQKMVSGQAPEPARARSKAWPAVAAQMLSVYRWLALGAYRPECVVS